jgi:hypothetical protein
LAASRSLRNISRKAPGVKDRVRATGPALKNTDDRTAALITGAMIEYGLERHLKVRMRKLKSQEAKDLFEGTGPLATFSGKIRLAYALGIIGPKARHDLAAINEIRNVFAHARHNLTFKSKRLRERIDGMHMVASRKYCNLRPGRERYLAVTNVLVMLLTFFELPPNNPMIYTGFGELSE